jgi:hypothetical protein
MAGANKGSAMDGKDYYEYVLLIVPSLTGTTANMDSALTRNTQRGGRRQV